MAAAVCAILRLSTPASAAQGGSVQALQSLHLDNLEQQRLGEQRLASLHLTNEKVRSQFLGDFDKAKKKHLDHTGGSGAGGKKKTMTAKQRAAMIAKMQVRP